MVTAIHIDDDIRSLDLMMLAAADLPELEIIESFTSGSAAMAWLATHPVDIIFLDVEMPEINGVDLANELAVYTADVIFVTAHTGFAINAFEACALDYLVKPIYPEKLRLSLERYHRRRSKLTVQPTEAVNPIKDQVQELLTNYINQESFPKRIFVSMVGEIKVINLADVLYFGANGPYTKIFLASGEVVMCSESIKSYSESLQKHPSFVRIHRSFLISKQAISSILRKAGNISVKMTNSDVLPIAQQRKSEIFAQLAS